MRKAIIAAIWLAVATYASVAGGVGYTFTKIADESGPLTGSFNTPPGLNDNGVAVFEGQLDSGPTGIFTGSGGALTTIAVTGGSTLSLNAPTINQSGVVAFRARFTDGSAGLYTGSGGPLTTLAEGIGFGPGPFGSLFGGPFINDGGVVAFAASGPFDSYATMVYLNNGSNVKIYDWNNAPDNDGTFFYVSLDDSGTAAIVSGPGPGARTNVFTGAGGAPVIVDSNDNPRTDFNFAMLNNGGAVAYYATPSGESATHIYVRDGGSLDSILSGGSYASFGGYGPALNHDGTVAFLATLAPGGTGIFTGPNPVADKVIQAGDPLFGSTVQYVTFGWTGLNNAGQLAFI